jgi:hypothetical protein
LTLELDRERGQKAEKLLNDPILCESFDLVRQAIVDQWAACPIRDKDGAHELKLMLKLLGDVRANLERAITDGKIAAIELEQLNRREQSPRDFLATYLKR